MADDKDNRGERDQATVSGYETYEVDYFATKHDLSRDEAQALVDRVGNNRDALEAAVAARATTAPAAKRGRPASAPKGATGSTTAKRKVASPKAKKTSTTRAPKSLAGTVADSVVPVLKSVAAAPRKVVTAASRGTASARKAAAAAPRATAKRAAAAVSGAKSAVTGRAASLVGAAAAGLVTGLAVNLGRKVVVQAPSALAGDWLEALKLEHKLALALFDKLQATGSDDTGKRTTLLTQLKHALGKHAFTEENVIYPALRASGNKVHADKLNHDHGYVKQNLYDLEEMGNASPLFLEKVASFRAELEEHIREEEDSIFPPLHAALGKDGNAKVTAQANKEGFKLA